jgi:general secretion pathway protein F
VGWAGRPVMVMQRFAFVATQSDGTVLRGVLAATDAERVADMLRAQGHWPTRIAPVGHQPHSATRLGTDDLAAGFRVLATLVTARVPIAQLLALAAPSLPSAWQRLRGDIQHALNSGASLSSAFRDAGVLLPPAAAGLLLAGERTGDLAGGLQRAADLAETSAKTRRTVVNALTYPALLACAGGAVVTLLVTVVIPRFAEVLESLGQPLPSSTRAILGAAEWLRHSAAPLTALAMILLVGLGWWTGTPHGRAELARWLLAAPVAGALRHMLLTARTARTLGALLGAGTPLSEALAVAADAAGDAAVEQRLRDARRRVQEGAPLGAALRESHAMTDSAVRLIAAGEAAGTLGPVLTHAADLESDRAMRSLNTLLRLLEPTLILLLGVLVGGVSLALLQAVYSVRASAL